MSTEIKINEIEAVENPKNNFKAWIIAAVIIGLVGLVGLGLIVRKNFSGENAAENAEKAEEKSAVKELKLEPELLNSAKLEYEAVAAKSAVSMLKSTGTIEANPQQTQEITSLVDGRIENISVSIGDRVSAGQTIAIITSPEVAQLQGKLHDAETKHQIAERNLNRVLKTENRVSILQAKAKLDEAEANVNRAKDLANLNSNKDVLAAETNFSVAKAKFDQADSSLKRTKKIVELGAGATKDLIAAETNYKTAKADFDLAENSLKKIKEYVKINAGREVLAAQTHYKTAKAAYDFESNISLNKEIQEARAEFETTKVDVLHISDEMSSLGINPSNHTNAENSSLVYIKSPSSGIVTDRKANNGSGVQEGQNLLTLSNVSSVWATANVPQDQMKSIYVGTSAEIKTVDGKTINAQVTNIDTNLNEDTRTGKVRLSIDNSDAKLKVGMFVEVNFRTGSSGTEIAVPSDAIQTVGGKSVVFVQKKSENGVFEIRTIEFGEESDGYTRIKKGLEIGETIVTKGSFTLKTQVEKGADEE